MNAPAYVHERWWRYQDGRLVSRREVLRVPHATGNITPEELVAAVNVNQG